jgi:hypothetical protein
MSGARTVLLTLVAVLGAALASLACAQGQEAAEGSPRATAPIDLTGQWVAIVNEDWRWRMVTPPKGDYTSVQPLNEAGRREADRWDPSEDGSCRAYGAAGLMRMPTRLRIRWESDTVLLIETDAGMQVRRLQFEPGEPGEPSRQGHSVARWQRPLPPFGVRGAPPREGGSLHVVTTNLLPGWLRRNGVPYSARTTMTEHFDRFRAPNGDEWLVVTSIVEDPEYLSGPFITSSHFRRETDESRWSPKPCKEP